MRVSRRKFMQAAAGMSGAYLLARYPGSPLWGAAGGSASPCLLHTGSGYPPFIDHFVDQLQPGRDGFVTEQYAAELEAILDTWRLSLTSSTRDLSVIQHSLSVTLDATALGEATLTPLRAKPPLTSEKAAFPQARSFSSVQFLETIKTYLTPLQKMDVAGFQIFGIQLIRSAPLQARVDIQYDLVATGADQGREERTGAWNVLWQKEADGSWHILKWTASAEARCRLTGPGFVDVTASCLGGNISYEQQLQRGVDYWRTMLDGATGIDIYGTNGIAVGDFDSDGFDDLYVCQPAGLPNRLYRNRGDGTFEDVTQRAGVAVLDGTSSAIFADLNNNGHQDLIVVRTGGPLLYVNRGDGTFALKPDAFRFAQPPKGAFTGTAVADYDHDGLLDVYFCLYSFYQGLSEYQYPSPYYDAQNGPPNFLLKNRGDYTFEDVTASSGMDRKNNRFSFTSNWNDYNNDGWPDLYVVNDFGRKVLYRNNGDGTFNEVSAEAGVEDPGEGMSMTWLDYDNDGFDDCYAVNMWEPAGQRVMTQDRFLPSVPDDVRRIYRQDALGNTLLHNERGKGGFRDVTEESGTRLGGWNWGSDAWDFDHDGYPDLYVANGFISGPQKDNLSSFFWRQVVSRSAANHEGGPSYEDAWNAINEFIRADHSWSGYQRNNCYLNNHDGTFTEGAGVLGLDFLDDSRSFALGDFNHDGRLEVVLKNRTAPQIRVLQNQLNLQGVSISFSLQGTTSNRDAIGAVIELQTTAGRQRKTVSAGSGFLMQHTKSVHFGLDEVRTPVSAVIRWPNGARQVFQNLPPGHRIHIVEGSASFEAVAFAKAILFPPSHSPRDEEILSRGSETWLVEPMPAPDFSLPKGRGKLQLKDFRDRPLALVFWRPNCEQSQKQLQSMQAAWAEWQRNQLQLLAIDVSDHQGVAEDSQAISGHGYAFPMVASDEATRAVYNIFHRYLFAKRRDLVLPSVMLLDTESAVIKIYSGYADPAHILSDWHAAPVGVEARVRKALPFPGEYLGNGLHHNHFTFGVAFQRCGYLDQALLSFQRAIDRNPSYAAAYYNTGLIYLHQRKAEDARVNLEKAAALDPSNANVWNNLGVACGDVGDYANASSAFQKALALAPLHFLALQNLVKLYKMQGHSEEALTLLESALAADPHRAKLHLALAMLLVEKNDLTQARSEFETVAQLQPDNPDAWNGLGVVLMKMGKTNEAITRFEQCRRLDPGFDRAYLNLALIYAQAGEMQKAHDLLSEYLLTQHESSDVRKALKEIDNAR